MSQSEMLEAASRIYEAADVEKEPLYILDPGNEVLQELVDKFCKIWSRSHRAPVACFFELQASEVGAIVGKQRRKVCRFDVIDYADLDVDICGQRTVWLS